VKLNEIIIGEGGSYHYQHSLVCYRMPNDCHENQIPKEREMETLQ
jgi:hypothetical protein